MSELYDAALVQYERMESLLSGYVGNCTELYSGSTAGGMGAYLKKVVTGWDAYSASPIHMEYFNEMKEASDTLAGGLEALAAEVLPLCDHILSSHFFVSFSISFNNVL